MTTDNFCFYLQNRLIQTGQTGGQWYSDTSTISIPWLHIKTLHFMLQGCDAAYLVTVPQIFFSLCQQRYFEKARPFVHSWT
jgi:hypothetical protein